MNQKIAVIGVSSILLVAAVVGTITYSISHKNSDNDNSELSSSSKGQHAICQSTNYKDTCEKSLANAKDDSDVKELIRVAFESAIGELKGAINNSTLLKEAAKDPHTAKAFEVCDEVLQSSIEDIERSVDRITNFDRTKLKVYLDDLETWLSGAITFQQTCIDAFENTTGDTGEKMKQLLKTTDEMSSNSLAMLKQFSKIFEGLQIPGMSSRRLLQDIGFEIPQTARRLLQFNDLSTLKPNAVVAQDGSGDFKTIQEAVNTAPMKINETFLIHIKEGVYKEYVEIPKKVYNVFLLGDGPTKTIITGNKNVIDGTETYKSATVAVNGDNFIAKDIGFENTAGAIKHQAVALRVTADKSIFYNCNIDGYQDTLYAHNHRQYYRDCTISGTIDFIFGDAAAVFQNCKMVIRKPMDNQACMVTAQGRHDINSKGAIVMQNCTITAEQEFLEAKPMPDAFLGRPWKNFSRTVIMQSQIENVIVPQGWAEWAGTFALDTLMYAEYENRGPGSTTDQRVKWPGIKKFSLEQAESFTPDAYFEATEWLEPTGFPYEHGMFHL